MTLSLLETFIKTAGARSFNRASELLFITPPAVVKQINLLENTLNLKLFDRSHRGLTLTPAGRSLYRDAVYITGYMRDAVERARAADGQPVIRIGVSPLTPLEPFMKYWPAAQKKAPGMRFMIVPFVNTPENAREILQYLGARVDVVPGIFDETLLSVRQCAGAELEKMSLRVAVPKHDPLSRRERLTFADLAGRTLLIMHQGWSCTVDRLRSDILKNHPSIRLRDFDFYDITVFNRCENNEGLLLAVDSWKTVHPMLKILPVEWNYEFSFGLLHSRSPLPEVRSFLDALKPALPAAGKTEGCRV
jgi:DNA-binding transcriptional LysR family regulator